jgi:hypothetical protein
LDIFGLKTNHLATLTETELQLAGKMENNFSDMDALKYGGGENDKKTRVAR